MGAAVDVGSNSIHLLVARQDRQDRRPTTAGAGLTVLLDQSELLGLGDAVDVHGQIPRDSRDLVLDALLKYAALSSRAGAQRLTLIGTEPLRRAANADLVAADVLSTTGLVLHVLSVRQEAELTFLGVTGGRAPSGPLIVVDIGGGSTEVGVFVPGQPLQVVALPVGSARLTNLIVEHDPPTDAEMDALHQAAEDMRRHLPTPPTDARGRPARAVFVGGTATNVARLGRLTRQGLTEDRRTLARLDAAAIVEHFGVRPRRAHQLAAGAAIVEVLLDHFALEEAEVSEASLREGAIIAEWRFAEEWLDRLDELFAAA